MPVDDVVVAIPFGQPSASSVVTDSLVPTLNVKNGFQWSHDDTPHTDEPDASSDATSDSDIEDTGSKKRKRKRKEIEQDLTADLQTKTPESNADFERLLLGSPNSSYLWIQYMSFQLQLSEVDKAREIARRALKTINFREEQEKLNVWISLLNLENVYGTDESIEATFKDAARHNDAKTVYLRLAAIFDQSEKYEVCVCTC
jgi:rRNA biogenesis protein RRP5